MADYVSSSRRNWPTYDGTTDHSNPQRLQVKNNLTAVTTGGPEWQSGQVPNGHAGGLGLSFDGSIAHAKTEKLRAVVGCGRA